MQPKGIIKMILFATYECVSKGSHNGGLWVVVKHSNIINKNSGWKKNKQQPSFHAAGAGSPEVDRSRLLSGIEVALIRRNASW